MSVTYLDFPAPAVEFVCDRPCCRRVPGEVRRERLQELKASGLTWAAIAREFGVSSTTLRRDRQRLAGAVLRAVPDIDPTVVVDAMKPGKERDDYVVAHIKAKGTRTSRQLVEDLGWPAGVITGLLHRLEKAQRIKKTGARVDKHAVYGVDLG
jgi:hypothetical protein